MTIRNSKDWEELESIEALGPDHDVDTTLYDRAWKNLEKLQKSGRLTSIDIFHLKELLESVYGLGKDAQREHGD